MTYYKLNEDKMFADITDNAAVIINSETGVYYGFNELGTEIYSNLENGVSSENILKKLETLTDNAEEQFKNYINFVLEHEIMLPSDEGDDGAEAVISEAIARECGFIIKADEYLDAQELLLADPIHEVKEDAGWSPEKSSLNEDKEEVARRKEKIRK